MQVRPFHKSLFLTLNPWWIKAKVPLLCTYKNISFREGMEFPNNEAEGEGSLSTCCLWGTFYCSPIRGENLHPGAIWWQLQQNSQEIGDWKRNCKRRHCAQRFFGTGVSVDGDSSWEEKYAEEDGITCLKIEGDL
jgi:hypothetical protein